MPIPTSGMGTDVAASSRWANLAAEQRGGLIAGTYRLTLSSELTTVNATVPEFHISGDGSKGRLCAERDG